MTVDELIDRLIAAEVAPSGSVYSTRRYDDGRSESIRLVLADGRYGEWYCAGGLDHGDQSYADIVATIRAFMAEKVLH